MTEAEWLACEDPSSLMEILRGISTERKWRLFAVACCRSIERMTPRAGEYAQECYLHAIRVAERFADGETDLDELHSACGKAGDLGYGQEAPDPFQWVASPDRESVMEVWEYALGVVWQEFSPETDGDACSRTIERERIIQAGFLRDIFGNPFRPVTFLPAWRTTTAAAIARGMYDSRDFSAMPILADALQDAGCDNADILTHCRDEGQGHVRGCWVVDMVLGKQ